MAQIFKPSSNVLIRAFFGVAAVTPWVLIYLGSAFSRSPYNTKVDVPLDQPVPFSHKHHAVELGIDCRFCHNYVEESAHAGVPSTQVCMTCHSQIWTNSPLLEPVRKSYETGVPIKWNKLNKVPEFVYFNHSIHINRGVSCNQCHGAIQDMQITAKGNSLEMRWCLNCHREPEKFLYSDPAGEKEGLSPREQVFNLYVKYQAGLELSPREQKLIDGKDYKMSHAEIEKGKQLAKQRGIKTAALEDCSVCHH